MMEENYKGAFTARLRSRWVVNKRPVIDQADRFHSKTTVKLFGRKALPAAFGGALIGYYARLLVGRMK